MFGPGPINAGTEPDELKASVLRALYPPSSHPPPLNPETYPLPCRYHLTPRRTTDRVSGDISLTLMLLPRHIYDLVGGPCVHVCVCVWRCVCEDIEGCAD
jgi:hypothetical protein